MPQRYQAPKHISGVFAPSRPLWADENGVIELADDAPDADREALLRAGFAPIAEAPPQKAAAAPKAEAGDNDRPE